MRLIASACLTISLIAIQPAQADRTPVDGRYEARVRTESGVYRVPVEVEDGEVTVIRWPNGGRMRVKGAELDDGQAVGRNSKGDRVQIEIEDPAYEPDYRGETPGEEE